jgi:hypothetical protein
VQVTLASVEYTYESGKPGFEIYVKKGENKDVHGVVFYRCKTCIVVAAHDGTIKATKCRGRVAKYAMALMKSGI